MDQGRCSEVRAFGNKDDVQRPVETLTAPSLISWYELRGFNLRRCVPWTSSQDICGGSFRIFNSESIFIFAYGARELRILDRGMLFLKFLIFAEGYLK